MPQKIIRSICIFTDHPDKSTVDRVNKLALKLENSGFVVQTKRICTKGVNIKDLSTAISDNRILFSVGTLTIDEANKQLNDFLGDCNVSFNVDLTHTVINDKTLSFLTDIIHKNADKTFNFTYVFAHASNSPFFPAATFKHPGFSVGLQPTNLSEGCSSLEKWCFRMEDTWKEIINKFQNDSDFLGIDSLIAPFEYGFGSFIDFVRKMSGSFIESTTTPKYTQLSKFIKEQNPKPIGLCGIMFPCLEDFELADEYEKGNFSIERNIYLSLHSGLGIDTYPIGIDEKPQRVLDILQLLQNLSKKYGKPLSARFVSDGNAKIGKRTDFKNQYLKDVTIRKL